MDDSRRVRVVAAALLMLSLGVAVLAHRSAPGPASAAAADADGAWRITAERRAAGPRFAPGVSSTDRAWILAAIARARPEARPLIGEVDGYVTFSTVASGPYLGLTIPSPRGTPIVLNVGYLDDDRRVDRQQTVLHELGHVIDAALVGPALDARFEAGTPRAGACAESAGVPIGACAKPNERFADTFAKWALRGSVSVTGGGYGVPMPPSLETWGAPLTALGVEVSQRGQ